VVHPAFVHCNNPNCGRQSSLRHISAGFVYVNNSQTEIDFEQARAKDSSGTLQWWLYLTNFLNLKATSNAILATALWSPPPPPTWVDFKLYKFTWTRDYIDFFVNDQFLTRHSTNVPKASANVIINHWGTNNPNGFGGPADLGERFLYVDWVRYAPPGVTPPFLPCPNP
jgi:beta-glucanase (GH16 family)